MSAFVVDQIIIDRAVAGFVAFADMPEDQADKIGRALWKTNIEAVCQRYNRDEILSEIGGLDDANAYEWSGEKVDMSDKKSILQTIKSMNCLHYQMSEGNVPSTLVYKTLASVIEIAEMEAVERYADKYLRAMKKGKVTVYDLAGYDACEW